MALNRQRLRGRLGARGVRVIDNASAMLTCSFPLEIDQIGRDGTVFRSDHTVKITGQYAEPCAEQLLAGDEVLVEGEPQDCSTGDPKTQEKCAKYVLSIWGVDAEHSSSGASRGTGQ